MQSIFLKNLALSVKGMPLASHSHVRQGVRKNKLLMVVLYLYLNAVLAGAQGNEVGSHRAIPDSNNL